MAITIELPPQMAEEARSYVMCRGTTIEQLLFDCLKEELARQRKADDSLAKLDLLVAKTSARLKGDSYQFRRADAYEPEEVFA